MRSSDNVGVTFVNLLMNRGILNNVVNLNFGVFNFTPVEMNGQPAIDPDAVTNVRLRMDLACAREVHAQLGALLDEVDKQDAELKAAPAVNGSGAGETPQKPVARVKPTPAKAH